MVHFLPGRPAGTRSGGFTLIEVLVTTVIVAIAVVGVFGGIRALTVTEARARSADLLQRLASEKLSDLRLLSNPGGDANAGDFGDRGYGDVSWTADVESSSAANVDQVTVTATRGADSQSLTTLMFVRPLTGTSGGGSPP